MLSPPTRQSRSPPGYLSVSLAVAESGPGLRLGSCIALNQPDREAAALEACRFDRVLMKRMRQRSHQVQFAPCGSIRWQKEDTVKNITCAALVFAAVCGFGSPALFAQNRASDVTPGDVIVSETAIGPQFAALRKDIRSVRKQIIAANLTLTDDEAPKFWPVYEQYSEELQNITDLRLALIQEYAEDYETLSDEEADRLVRLWQAADVSADELRQKYVPIMRKVLPAKKTATFFQLERQISMTIEMHLTSRLPLMQNQE